MRESINDLIKKVYNTSKVMGLGFKNDIKIFRVKHLYKVSKSGWKIGLAGNIFFQAMINNIIYTLMLNGIIPTNIDIVNILRIILITSFILLYLSFYSIILFKDKKDLQKQFFIALVFSGTTYILGYVCFSGANIY